MGWQSWQKARKVKIGDSIAKAIFLYLAECLNEQTGQCNPSQETIAEELEISLPSVKRKIKLLSQIGLILPLEKTKNGRRTGTNYQLFYGISQNGFSVNGIRETPSMVSDSQSNGICEIPKEEEEQEIEEEETHIARAGNLPFPVKEIFESFPEVEQYISPTQCQLLISSITNKVAFERTIQIYKGNYNRRYNRYLPEKVSTFISVYEKELTKITEKKNGTNKPDGNNKPPTAGEIIANRSYR